MTPPSAADIPQNVAECYRLQKECRQEREAQHGEIMGKLGTILDQLAEQRGARAEQDKQKATLASTPVPNKRSWVTGLGTKILEWVIITAVAGGLYAAVKQQEDANASAPAPAAGAKP